MYQSGAGLRERRPHDRVPAGVGQERLLGDQRLGRRGHRVAGAGAGGGDRLGDPLRDHLGRPAEAPQQALLVRLDVRRLHRGVEVRVRAVARRPGARVLAEAGEDDPRLDDDHVDAEAADLEAQRVGDRLHRVLARVVVAGAGEGEAPAHRGDVDDLAPALRAHRREHELAHADEAEDVRLELRADLLERDGLDRARLAVAGVVDQHADRAVLLLHGGDGGLHRGLVGDVEGERAAARRLEVREGLGAAGGRVDGPAEARRGGGRWPPRSPTSSR